MDVEGVYVLFDVGFLEVAGVLRSCVFLLVLQVLLCSLLILPWNVRA